MAANALQYSGYQKCRAVALSMDDGGNERNEQRRARTEAPGDDPRREPAPVWKPFERAGNRAAVNERRTHAGNRV